MADEFWSDDEDIVTTSNNNNVNNNNNNNNASIDDKKYYEILNVQCNCTQEEIYKAYKKQAKLLHPDRHVNKPNQHEFAAKFQDLQKAYNVLKNPQSREFYDKFGESGRNLDNNTIFDLFPEVFKAENPLKTALHKNEGSKRLSNIKRLIYIQSNQAKKGMKYQLKYKRENICTKCFDTGAEILQDCTMCNGQGFIVNKEKLAGIMVESRDACLGCDGKGKTIAKQCQSCKGAGGFLEEINLIIDIPKNCQHKHQILLKGLGSQYLLYNSQKIAHADLMVVICINSKPQQSSNYFQTGYNYLFGTNNHNCSNNNNNNMNNNSSNPTPNNNTNNDVTMNT